MSRSRKKHPITGVTGSETEKEFKRQEHQRERSHVRDALMDAIKGILESDKEILPHPKQFGDPWDGPKDGKFIWDERQDKAKRK